MPVPQLDQVKEFWGVVGGALAAFFGTALITWRAIVANKKTDTDPAGEGVVKAIGGVYADKNTASLCAAVAADVAALRINSDKAEQREAQDDLREELREKEKQKQIIEDLREQIERDRRRRETPP